MDDSQIRIFGIRHHGPGCARSLVRAFEEWQPDALLVEGPPEGESVLPLAVDEAGYAYRAVFLDFVELGRFVAQAQEELEVRGAFVDVDEFNVEPLLRYSF